jgi:hypothetical protein
MALTSTDLKFMYSERWAQNQVDRCGGACGMDYLPVMPDAGVMNLFNFAVRYEDTYVQYQKIFIRNFGDETAQNVLVWGVNANANSIVKFAIECGQDQLPVVDGNETTINSATAPHLYNVYDFVEVPFGSPISVPDIPSGSALGIWVKLEFSTVDAFNVDDIFGMGVKFEGVAHVQFSTAANIQHSRIDAVTNIISVKKSSKMFNGYDLEYEWIDTDVMGIPSNEAVYALYVDRIFKMENSGSSKMSIQLYDVDVPILIEIFLLPYGGYRPTLQPPDEVNRIKLMWETLNPEIFDIERHVIYWDEATGTYQTKPFIEVTAKDGNGGGNKIESTQKII